MGEALKNKKGPTQGHASGNGRANLHLLPKSGHSFCAAWRTTTPTLPNFKKGKEKDGREPSQRSLPPRAILGRSDVSAGQSGSRSQGTVLAERGKQPTRVLTFTRTQGGRKEEGKCSWLVWRDPCETGMDALTCQRAPRGPVSTMILNQRDAEPLGTLLTSGSF